MITCKEIINLVELKSGYKIVNNIRIMPIPDIRFLAIALCKEFSTKETTHEEIGTAFGKDYSSISYALKKFKERKNLSFYKKELELYNDCKDYILKNLINNEILCHETLITLGFKKCPEIDYRYFYKDLIAYDIDDFNVCVGNTWIAKKYKTKRQMINLIKCIE